jgi:hypothetical protein
MGMMGKAQRLKWERRWSRMRAVGLVPKAGSSKDFTREEWQVFDRQNEIDGRTLTRDEREAKLVAAEKALLEKFYAGGRATYPGPPTGLMGIPLEDNAGLVANDEFLLGEASIREEVEP